MEDPAFKLALLLVGRTDELIIAYGAIGNSEGCLDGYANILRQVHCQSK